MTARRYRFWVILALLTGLGSERCLAASDSSIRTVDVLVPEYKADGEANLCTRVLLLDQPQRLVAVEPLSTQEVVHHMLLYGCSSSGNRAPVWECVGHMTCEGAGQQILYGWGKNAPAMRLPPGVGFHVGEGSAIRSLVLQVHYLNGRPDADKSGVRLTMTSAHMPFAAGMLMYASSFSIPPGRPSTKIPNQCCLGGFEPAHGFAFRVHTHALGRLVYLDRLEDREHRRVVQYSPQLPQGFTPANVTFWPGEVLEATCDFDSRGTVHAVHSGNTHHDEMCNLYFMMWTEMPIFLSCFDHRHIAERHGPGGIHASARLLPESDLHWRPPPTRTAAAAAAQADSSASLGLQNSGVAKGHNGTLWVLHRGGRVWDAQAFEGERTAFSGAIQEDVVLQLDQDTGEVLARWGSGELFLPHMVTVDRDGNLWVADVALHQVIKYSPTGQRLLELGKRLEPGHDTMHLCKPTHVVLANRGTVYVADGYCNSRILAFSPDGTYQGSFELAAPDSMMIPHSLAIDECKDALFVADREAARVHQFSLSTRQLKGSWDLKGEGKVYAIAIGPYGVLLALCWDRDGPGSPSSLVLLGEHPGSKHSHVWRLEGVRAPHDIALAAAPLRLASRERPLAVLVAESQPAGSRLAKFLLLPPGSELPADVGDPAEYLPASQSWQHILAATAGSADNQLQAAAQQDLQGEDDGMHAHHVHHRSLHNADLNDIGSGSSFMWPGWPKSWLAWLLYGGGGSSLLDVEEQDELDGFGYNVNDAVMVSVPVALLALTLAVLLWRLAAPLEEEHQVGSPRRSRH